MITRRVSTKLEQPQPPVRFYRTIAVSFLIITLALLGVIIFFTSKKATIIIVAKNDNKNVSLNVAVEKQKTSELSVEGDIASGVVALSQKYYPTGNKEVNGVAEGEVTIYNKTGADQPLVKTTRLLTPEGVLFRLSQGVVAPANGQVAVKVYADKAGSSGDIGPSKFTIPGLNETKQKVIYAESAQAMSGGVHKTGILTEDDLKMAQTDYLEKAKQAAQNSTSSLPGYDQKAVAVAAGGNIKANHKAGEEIDSFTLSGTSTAVTVYYNKADLQAVIDKQVANNVDLASEKIITTSKDPQVSLASYDVAKNTAQLSVYQDTLVTLDSNGEKLAAANFMNKNKDEIERYVLGLSHAVGVEIRYSPSWLRKAPGVAERIKVVVKNVE